MTGWPEQAAGWLEWVSAWMSDHPVLIAALVVAALAVAVIIRGLHLAVVVAGVVIVLVFAPGVAASVMEWVDEAGPLVSEGSE